MRNTAWVNEAFVADAILRSGIRDLDRLANWIGVQYTEEYAKLEKIWNDCVGMTA